MAETDEFVYLDRGMLFAPNLATRIDYKNCEPSDCPSLFGNVRVLNPGLSYF